MTFRAIKIPLTCDEDEIRRWAAYMTANLMEVSESLRREGVRSEAWFLCPEVPLSVIGVMEVEDAVGAALAAEMSRLAVDQVHRAFKAHWRRDAATPVRFDPDSPDPFPGCELLFQCRA